MRCRQASGLVRKSGLLVPSQRNEPPCEGESKIRFTRARDVEIPTMKAQPPGGLLCARLFLQELRSCSLSVTYDCRPRSVERAWVIDSEVHLKLLAIIDQLE